MIPEELNSKIINLDMAPADWAMLDDIVEPRTYLAIVREYQAREREKLPRCKGIFGVCRYNDHGRCSCNYACELKIRQTF